MIGFRPKFVAFLGSVFLEWWSWRFQREFFQINRFKFLRLGLFLYRNSVSSFERVLGTKGVLRVAALIHRKWNWKEVVDAGGSKFRAVDRLLTFAIKLVVKSTANFWKIVLYSWYQFRFLFQTLAVLYKGKGRQLT